LPTWAGGGQLTPGDTVAVLASFDPFDLDGVVIAEDPAGPVNEPVTAAPARTPNTTHIIVHKVVVTSVQAAPAEPAEDGAASPIPPGELLVTLAVTPADVERVVFSAEFGLLWLARQGDDVPEAGTRVQTRASVYEPTGGRARRWP
jgi:pilus assembly protein CpaB